MQRISLAATNVYPQEVLDYKSSRTSANLVHPIIGRTDPDVTFGPARLRRGTLKTYWLTTAQAFAAADLHAQAGVFKLTSDEMPAVNMSYVVDGNVVPELDHETMTWFVSIDYQEVLA